MRNSAASRTCARQNRFADTSFLQLLNGNRRGPGCRSVSTSEAENCLCIFIRCFINDVNRIIIGVDVTKAPWPSAGLGPMNKKALSLVTWCTQCYVYIVYEIIGDSGEANAEAPRS